MQFGCEDIHFINQFPNLSPMPSENLHIACLQMDLAWQQPAANLEAASRLLEQLSQPVDLILLPEMFSTGFTTRDLSQAEALNGRAVQWMQEQAAARDCLLGGSLLMTSGSRHVNRFVWVSGEGMIGHYDKRHLFSMAGEDALQAGNRHEVVSWRGWNLMPLICYDLRFPVWSRNRFEADGEAMYDLLVYVASWPSARIHHWDALLKARAIENQAFVAGVNRIGTDGNGFAYNGHTQVIDFSGKEVHAPEGEAFLLETTLDAAELAAYRGRFPFWREADHFGWT